MDTENNTSSSTPSPDGGWDYEVFLSFRGADTHHTFTDHLYNGLWTLEFTRLEKGSYEEAFQKHEEKYKDDIATVEGWKNSLREVAELKGWEVKNVADRINDEIVGVNSDDVRIVGIHGMGGIRKTTVAKVIYDKLSRQFQTRCFLEDVRKTAQQHNGLVHLQSQLISSILKQGRPVLIGSIDDGIIAIKHRFSGKKVLLVIDNVDHIDHLRAFALLGKRDWFGSGSRIIITTRDLDILKQAVVNSTYEPKELDDYQALQLFSNIEKKEWEDKLKELKIIPNEDVQKKLQTSYDALNDIQKQIFLGVACLFIGVDTRIASRMWESNINIGVLLRLFVGKNWR
ncbi:disease resistance protein RPV1-like [Cornus florida]|uniref:disease resistance protein RPV1-like n=1 Tax=Cornus florida TaxID=4283 RepID=UPI00289DE5C5|nr:disease resistance protein RPV1-like [Cornus florida]